MYRSILFSGTVLFIGCTGGKTIEVRNSTPEAWITSHSDQAEILAGDVVLFIGSASDSNHQENDLLTNWYADNRELCMGVVPEVDGTTICEIALEEGDEVLRLQVVDPLGDTDFDEILEMNVEKLSARYPEGTFDVHKSENRKDGDV